MTIVVVAVVRLLFLGMAAQENGLQPEEAVGYQHAQGVEIETPNQAKEQNIPKQ